MEEAQQIADQQTGSGMAYGGENKTPAEWYAQEALRMANNISETPDQVVERARKYLAFILSAG